MVSSAQLLCSYCRSFDGYFLFTNAKTFVTPAVLYLALIAMLSPIIFFVRDLYMSKRLPKMVSIPVLWLGYDSDLYPTHFGQRFYYSFDSHETLLLWSGSDRLHCCSVVDTDVYYGCYYFACFVRLCLVPYWSISVSMPRFCCL